MNRKPATSKELGAKHIKILEGLLKLPENKECADCRRRAPRWASINLGIFICLQCSGVHRSLGVHISKVRSTTLDTWLPEQVAFIQSMGNDKSNAYWEAELPLHYDKNQIENFIHAKYVEKRWILKDCKVKPSSSSIQELACSRPSRRYGAIAEWTNNQHLFKGRRDCSTAERDRAESCPSNVEDCSGNKNGHQHQQQEKEANCRTSVNQSASDLKSFNGKPTKESAQVIPSIRPNDSLRKSEQEALKIKLSTADAMTAVPSPKTDYASELFITLSMDDSADYDSNPPEASAWVHFDSDQESSTTEAEIAPKPAVEKALIHEAKLTFKSSARKVNPEPTIEDVQTATKPLTNGHFGDQKYDVNNNQRLSEKPNLVSASSIHLQRLEMLAQGVSATGAPMSAGSIHRQLNVNGGSVERTTDSQMPMQNSQPVNLAVNSAPYTMSSLYTPASLSRSVSAAPARRPPAALPVSGYDYDFSFLTRGMFKKR